MIWAGIFGSDFCVMVLDFVVKREIKESLSLKRVSNVNMCVTWLACVSWSRIPLRVLQVSALLFCLLKNEFLED